MYVTEGGAKRHLRDVPLAKVEPRRGSTLPRLFDHFEVGTAEDRSRSAGVAPRRQTVKQSWTAPPSFSLSIPSIKSFSIILLFLYLSGGRGMRLSLSVSS